MTKESTHVYMNLDVVNNSTTTPKQLVFNMTRTIPFLTNAEDYFLTVVRFNLQTSNSLPVFIPDIQTGQNSPNLTVYSITLYGSYNGRTSTIISPVYYIPNDLSQPTPSPPTTTVDKSSSYYWVENVTDWVAMLNSTLTYAMTQLNANLLTTYNAPYILYDLTTGLFTLSVEQLAVQNAAFQVYFNPTLYNILPFPSIYRTVTGSSTGVFMYQINIANTLANRITNLINDVKVNFLSSTTEFSPLPLMCPIRSIYFATNLLPIEPLLTTPAKVYSDTALSGGNSGSPGITNVLTDFELAVSPTNTYNGEISYQPSAEYRMIDLTQGMNLNKLDLSAFWKDKYGNSYPIYLPVGCSSNVKLLFRKKSFNMNENY